VHELSIAHEIYRTCRAVVAAHGGGTLAAVRVAVGELTAVEPDLLVFAWEAVVAEGKDHQARLEVEWRQARQFCPACGADKRQAEASWLPLCPDCGGPLQVAGGDDLDILSVEILGPEEES